MKSVWIPALSRAAEMARIASFKITEVHAFVRMASQEMLATLAMKSVADLMINVDSMNLALIDNVLMRAATFNAVDQLIAKQITTRVDATVLMDIMETLM
jgi:hypothetical protein